MGNNITYYYPGFPVILSYLSNNDKKKLSYTVRYNKDFIIFMINNDLSDKVLNKHILYSACKYGYLDIFNLVIKKDIKKYDISNAISEAIYYYHFDIIKSAHENGILLDKSNINNAMKYNHLDIVLYAHENGILLDRSNFINAIKYNRLDVIVYAHENGILLNQFNIINNAIKYNCLDIIKYVHENGILFDKSDIYYAIKYNRLDIIIWAYVNRPIIFNNIRNISNLASEFNNVEIIIWAIKNNFEIDKNLHIWSLRANHFDIFKLIYEKEKFSLNNDTILELVIDTDDFKIIKWIVKMFIKENIELDKRLVDWLVQLNRVYLVPKGNKWLCSSIALYGTLTDLKKAHKNGYPWDIDTTNNIIRSENFHNKLDMLKYAHQNGCPCDKSTTKILIIDHYAFSHYENKKCLSYLHEKGCPSDNNYYASDDELEFYGTTPYWPVSKSPLKVSRKKKRRLPPRDGPWLEDLLWDVVYDPNNPS